MAYNPSNDQWGTGDQYDPRNDPDSPYYVKPDYSAPENKDPDSENYTPPKTPLQRDAEIRDYLNKRFMPDLSMAQNTDTVQEDQDKLRDARNASEVGQAVGSFFAPQYQAQNQAFGNVMKGNAQDQIRQDLLDRELGQQNLEFGQKALGLNRTNDLSDPGSEQSKTMRAAMMNMFPDSLTTEGPGGERVPIEGLQYLSGEDLKDYMTRPLELHDLALTRKAIAEQNNLTRQMLMAQRYPNGVAIKIPKTVTVKNQKGGDSTATTSDDDEDQDQAQASPTPNLDPYASLTDKQISDKLTHLQDKLTSTSQRNELGRERMKMDTAYHGMYLADKKDLTLPEVKELGAQVAQTLVPGQPTEEVIRGVTPNNIRTWFADMMTKYGGAPANADQSEYVELFKGMLQRQMRASQNIISNAINPIIAGTGWIRDTHGKKFRPTYDAFFDQYGGGFDNNNQLKPYKPKIFQPENMPGGANYIKENPPAQGPKDWYDSQNSVPQQAVTNPAPGGYGQPSPTPNQNPTFQKDVQDYATKYGKTYQEALFIKQQRLMKEAAGGRK